MLFSTIRGYMKVPFKIVMLLILFSVNSYSQEIFIGKKTEQKSDFVYPDTALYDKYDFNYKFSQFMKNSIRYGSIVGATGLAISTSYIVQNDIHDGIGVGIITAMGAVYGTGLGYLSGSIVGLIIGSKDEDFKTRNPKFYHRMNHFGYSIGSIGPTAESDRAGIHFSLSMRNLYKRAYFPERIYLTFEYLDWYGDHSESENHFYTNRANEFRYGTILRYYFIDRAILNYYYEFGFGYTTGEYWSFDSNSFDTLDDLKKDFSFVYGNISLGIELNMFDFFYGDLSLVVEPIGPLLTIHNDHFSSSSIFMLRLSIGTYIF
jgi:hypothetical protein